MRYGKKVDAPPIYYVQPLILFMSFVCHSKVALPKSSNFSCEVALGDDAGAFGVTLITNVFYS